MSKVCDDVKKDLSWFIEFLLKFNGKVMFAPTRPHHDLFVDASLTGVGAIWENNVYWVSHHMAATAQLSISWLEMLNVLIALRLIAAAWQHKSVCVHIDNKTAVFSLQRGKIENIFMQAIARTVWLIADSYDINLMFEHISGSINNKADMLSRLFQSADSFKMVQEFKNCVWWPDERSHVLPKCPGVSVPFAVFSGSPVDKLM